MPDDNYCLNVNKTKQSITNFKDIIGDSVLENYDALVITNEYKNDTTHIISENSFYNFLKGKTDSKINIIEYRKKISKITVVNSLEYNIGEFILRDIVLPLFISYLYDFIKLNINKEDKIRFTITIDKKEKDNVCIEYYGSVDNFKKVIEETNNLNGLLDNDT